VGDYRLETRVDVPQARRGEPFTLSARVSGTGHVQTIGAPIWPDWGGLRVYDSGEAVSVEKGRDRVGGEKSFTQVLIAQRAGRVRLDPVRFVYFDPARGRYVRTEGAPLEIEVIEGGALAPGADDGSAVGQDILYIRTGIEGELRRQAATGSPVAWVVLGLPLALVAGGGWWRRRTAAGGRAVLGRRSQAHRRARRALAALPPDGDGPRVASGVAEALETYLTAWLDVSVRGTTRRELRAALLERGLAEDLAQRATGALDRSEEIRFGAGGGADAGAGLRRDAETLLGELEAALRRAPRGPSS
jgi:hypothetical protein